MFKKCLQSCAAFFVLGCAVADAQPAEVILVAPVDASETAALTPTFAWNPAEGAFSYEIEVARKRNMKPTTINVDGLTGTTFTPENELDEGRQYYWRVRAVDEEDDNGPWSEQWSFETGRLPDKAHLLSPDNHEQAVVLHPELVWEATNGASEYDVEIALDSDFSSLVYDVEGVVATSLTVPIQLEPDTRYYWRVRASNLVGDGQYSDTRWFETVQSAPAQVSLLFPADGATGVSTKPTFSWEPAPGADSYTLEVSTSSSFSVLLLEETGVSGTSFTPSSAFVNGEVLHWRVHASNGAGDGPYSPVRDFTTAIGGATQAVLVSPPNNSDDVDVSPTLLWNSVAGAASYRVQVSTQSNFSNLLYDTVVGGTELHVGPLAHDATHFWRVLASNAGSQNWSNMFSFSTAAGTPAQVTLQSPDDGAAEQPLEPVLTWAADPLAESYNLQIGLDPEFSVLLVSEQGLTGTSYTVVDLDPSTDYFWRVQAANGAGVGPWSPPRKFTTRIVLAPEAPVLTYPPNGAEGVVTNPVFSWSGSERADSYKLEVSTLPPDEFGNFVTVVTVVVVTQPFFQSPQLSEGKTHYWRVESRNAAGSAQSPVWNFVTASTTAAEQDELPVAFSLEQNYPNPFNPSTRIRYALPERSSVHLSVSDVSGRLVTTLVAKEQAAGVYDATWDGRGDDGSPAASGVYLCRLAAAEYVKTIRLVLAK